MVFWHKLPKKNWSVVTPYDVQWPKNFNPPKNGPKTARKWPKMRNSPKMGQKCHIFPGCQSIFLKIVLNHLYICILKGYKWFLRVTENLGQNGFVAVCLCTWCDVKKKRQKETITDWPTHPLTDTGVAARRCYCKRQRDNETEIQKDNDQKKIFEIVMSVRSCTLAMFFGTGTS